MLIVVALATSFFGCGQGARTGVVPGDSGDTPELDTHSGQGDTSSRDVSDDTVNGDGEANLDADSSPTDSIGELDGVDDTTTLDTDAAVDDDTLETADTSQPDSSEPSGEVCGTGHPDCPSERPWCESVYHVCVECEVETAAQVYGGCGPDAFCGRDWKCHDATSCMIDTDCADSPHGNRCNPNTYRCAECGTDWHCSADQKCQAGVCTPATSCTDGHECPSSESFCDPVTKRCVGCVESTNIEPCPGMSARCEDRTCVPIARVDSISCSATAECRKFGVDCDLNAGACRACVDDGDCAATRYCDTNTGQCLRDVCKGTSSRCQLPCWVTPTVPGMTQCNPQQVNIGTSPGAGAVYECAQNGSAWNLRITCGAGQQCTPLTYGIADCRAWPLCDPGDVACDGYAARLTCNGDGYFEWSQCTEPRVCGSNGECEIP